MNQEILKSLLFNVMILICVPSIIGRLTPFNDGDRPRSLNIFYVSSVSAIVAMLCMIFPIIKGAEFIFDLRSTPIVILGMAWGFTPALAAAILSGTFRLLLGGDSVYYGVVFGTILPAVIGGIYYRVIRLLRNVNTVSTSLRVRNMIIIGIVIWIKDVIAFRYYIHGGVEVLQTLGLWLPAAHIFSSLVMGLVIRDNYILSQYYNRLKEETLTDELTGLKNYRYIVNEVYGLIDDAKEGCCLTVMMVDIDEFKKYNDAYGHSEGNRVLTSISRILMASVREGDIVARYGGEEFLIILNGVHIEDAYNIAERVRQNVSEIGTMDKRIIKRHVTISIGLAGYPMNGSDMCELINKADIALYKAKELGRDNVQIYRSPDSDEAGPRKIIEI